MKVLLFASTLFYTSVVGTICGPLCKQKLTTIGLANAMGLTGGSSSTSSSWVNGGSRGSSHKSSPWVSGGVVPSGGSTTIREIGGQPISGGRTTITEIGPRRVIP